MQSPVEQQQQQRPLSGPTGTQNGPAKAVPRRLPPAIRAVKDADGYRSRGRNVIVLLDGTGDKFDADNSNIVHLISCMKKDDPSQVTYYQSGIGTYNGAGLSSGFSAAVDAAVGSGLGVHIRDAYRFIMSVYKEGDKISIFGFSRGAYTARCLAGMLHKVGLLPGHNTAQIAFAYQFYKDESAQGWEMSLDFKKTFCQDISVHFLGLFDSVASVGFIPRKLPLSNTPTNQPVFFRHAMALDEHRAKFKVCRFRQAVAEVEKEAETIDSIGSPTAGNQTNVPKRVTTNGSMNGMSEKVDSPDGIQRSDTGLSTMSKLIHNTNVLEVWFTGCHADVGGGAVKNEVRHKLSQIPLRWMLRQCFECNTGIVFKTKMLAEQGLDVHTLWPFYQPLSKPVVGPSPALLEKYVAGTVDPIARRSTHLNVQPERRAHLDEEHEAKLHEAEETTPLGDWTPEQTEDYFDALSPINDQLVQARGWWILEAWPIKVRIIDQETEKWMKKVRMNLGRYRPVQDQDPNLHWTVKQRIEQQKYKIRTRGRNGLEWVEVV